MVVQARPQDLIAGARGFCVPLALHCRLPCGHSPAADPPIRNVVPRRRHGVSCRDYSAIYRRSVPKALQVLIKLAAAGRSHDDPATRAPGGKIEQQFQQLDQPGSRYLAPRVNQTLDFGITTAASEVCLLDLAVFPACPRALARKGEAGRTGPRAAGVDRLPASVAEKATKNRLPNGPAANADNSSA